MMKMKMKGIIRSVLGETATGMISYILFPSRGAEWGGPFNGQVARQALFREIIDSCQPSAVIETGTYLGTTTEFLADTGLPIYSIESDRRNYGFARARHWRRRNVSLFRGDSRETLHKLIDGPLHALANNSSLFFYLDAHWNDDLPLAGELELIFNRCSAAVVMIDDFQVPFDAGYVYDDYGDGKALVPQYIAPTVSLYGLRSFYPSTPSVTENGLRRGCVVLANQSALVLGLSSLPLLRQYEGQVRIHHNLI